MFVKICGITDVAAAETCVEENVDAMGFVFDPSPRRVTPRQAAAISAAVPSDLLRVAVFRSPSPERVESVLEEFDADIVQADHGTLEAIPWVGILPVVHAGIDEPPEEGWFLYEGPTSGVGEQVDLDRAADWARRGEMLLAGGLRPDNVGHAIERVRPIGVDVSSGVESEPGVKSPELIRSFVAAVRAAEGLVNQ